jgi:hypothetical protein
MDERQPTKQKVANFEGLSEDDDDESLDALWDSLDDPQESFDALLGKITKQDSLVLGFPRHSTKLAHLLAARSSLDLAMFRTASQHLVTTNEEIRQCCNGNGPGRSTDYNSVEIKLARAVSEAESLELFLKLETVADVFVANSRAPHRCKELEEQVLGMQRLNVTVVNDEDNLKSFDAVFERVHLDGEVHMACPDIARKLRTGKATIKFRINASSSFIFNRLFRLW